MQLLPPIEARLPEFQRTSLLKSVGFGALSFLVIFVYIGIPLTILSHTWIHSLLYAAGVAAGTVAMALIVTVSILRATSKTARAEYGADAAQ